MLRRKLRIGGELFFQSDVFDLALDAMAVLEDASDALRQRRRAVELRARKPVRRPIAARGALRGSRRAHLAHVLPSRRCVERSSSQPASARWAAAPPPTTRRSTRSCRRARTADRRRSSGDASAVKALRERIWHAGAEARDPALQAALSRALAAPRGLRRVGDEAAVRAQPREARRRLRRRRAAARRASRRARSTRPRRGCPMTTSATAIASATTAARRVIYDSGAGRCPTIRRRWRWAGSPACRARRTRTTGCRTWRSATSRRCSRAIRAASPFRRRCTRSAPTSPRATPLLAVLAARLPNGQRLALTHAGAAAHHIEDVANQIHTVQVGIYEFFVDAKIESIKEELALGRRPLARAPGLRLDRHRHHLQPSRPRRVAVRQAPARARRSRSPSRRQPHRRIPSCSAALDARPAGVRTRLRARDRRRAHRALELRRARGLSRHPRRRAAPLVARRPALRRHRRSRRGAQAGRRPDALLRARGGAARAARRRRSTPGGRASAAARRSTTPPPARSPSSSCANGSTRSTPPKGARGSDEPKAPDESKRNWWVPIGYVFVLLVVALLVRRMRRRGARSETSSDRAPPPR